MEVIISIESLDISTHEIREKLLEKLDNLSIEEMMSILNDNSDIKQVIANNIVNRYFGMLKEELFKKDEKAVLVDLGKKALKESVISPIIDDFMKSHAKEIDDALTEAFPDILCMAMIDHFSATSFTSTISNIRNMCRNDTRQLIREAFHKGGH